MVELYFYLLWFIDSLTLPYLFVSLSNFLSRTPINLRISYARMSSPSYNSASKNYLTLPTSSSNFLVNFLSSNYNKFLSWNVLFCDWFSKNILISSLIIFLLGWSWSKESLWRSTENCLNLESSTEHKFSLLDLRNF